MTIRQVLRRRMLLWFLMLLLIGASAWILLPLHDETVDAVFPMIIVAGVGGGFALSLFGFRCPRCAGNLWLIAQGAAFSWGKRRISFCPYCGCSLDEKWQAKKT
jgi:hypothetical protein